MIAMDYTIAGAASGETAGIRSAEGFIISGKRTEEYGSIFVMRMAISARQVYGLIFS
jgi:hypothetical protein